METNTALHLEITKYVNREREYESINQMLKDEHQALQLAFASLEDKLRKSQVCFIVLQNYINFMKIMLFTLF